MNPNVCMAAISLDMTSLLGIPYLRRLGSGVFPKQNALVVIRPRSFGRSAALTLYLGRGGARCWCEQLVHGRVTDTRSYSSSRAPRVYFGADPHFPGYSLRPRAVTKIHSNII